MAELLRRHWDIAVVLAGRVLGSPDLGRDAAQEAAVAELGISTGAVKARLHQARSALAPRLVQFTTIPEVRKVMATEEAAEWVEAVVGGVTATSDEDILQRQYVMILLERGGARGLAIWIGPAEAGPLALALESVESPRPFAYSWRRG
jgi:hypothetical protein